MIGVGLELRAVEIVVILVSSERAKKADDSCIGGCASKFDHCNLIKASRLFTKHVSRVFTYKQKHIP